ncbi:tetratricopeptide repeat protein [Novosphingobium arvoryzae]|uniref:Sel1 repeat family protein n=1 Tax=Novosphingobium arvoryzae TaxID=1256514 RepID=A0A918RNY9_9SPHN|nr:tetratricopeptide repeat protein [Novosphingobium arvoryzae]GHA03591.1 hypothetical protein GCM10011617_25890 [Novosphingobium arvoryzae]
MVRPAKWLAAATAAYLSSTVCLAQGVVTNSVIGAYNKAEQAQQQAAARKAAAARAAKLRALEEARAKAARQQAERAAAIARQEAARRSEEMRRAAAAEEAARRARIQAEDAARRSAMEAEATARRQALLEAEQKAAELRRINEINAQNQRTELEQKARAGDAQAALALARIFEKGEYVAPSATDAEAWYKMAAELGSTEAQMRYIRTASLNPSSQSDPLVIKYLTALATAQNPEALLLLAQRYASAGGVPQDKRKALELLRTAADAGYLEAQEALGQALQDGSLGERNYRGAIDYLLMAANQGSLNAQLNLGMAYEYGLGVKKSPEIAFRSYKAVYQQDRRIEALERMRATDAFGYPGKNYDIAIGYNLKMDCPAADIYLKVEFGVIKEQSGGVYLEHNRPKKEKGRNLYKFGGLIKTIADFDQRKLILLGLGKTVFDCE